MSVITAGVFTTIFIFPEKAYATTETFTSSTTWTAPTGVTSVTAEVWGAGGGGGGGVLVTGGGGGGGGGAYSKKTSISVTPGNNYTVTIGAGGSAGASGANGTAGGDSLFVDSGTVLAKGGSLGALGPLGAGGAGGASGSGIGDTKFSGGTGGTGGIALGGGGGGGAGDSAVGGNANLATSGSAGSSGGGAGASGGISGGTGGTNNAVPGGGGAGGGLGSTSGSAGKSGQVTLTYTITPVTLTVTGITADNKIYDGTATAALNVGSATLVGVVGVDIVTLNTGSATGVFNTAAVGTGKTVTVSGLTLSGASAGSYTLTQPTTTANVTARSLTVTASDQTKTYGSSSLGSSSFTSSGLQNSETIGSVTLTSNAALSTSGNHIAGTSIITPSSATGGIFTGSNYSITYTTGNLTVSAKSLTVIGITASNKVYDDTATATLSTGSAALSGVVSGDTVTLNTGSAAGTFSDRHVGVGKTVTLSGLAISGADSGNYSLTQPTTTANITARAVTVTAGTENKIYDGTTASAGTPTVTSGALSGDDTIATISQTFDDKNIGTGKTLTAAGSVTDSNSGSNYSLTLSTNTTGEITSKSLTVTGITASNKTYDGNTTTTLNIGSASLVGVLGGDTVTLNTGSAAGVFDSASSGTGKTVTISGLAISGADAGNYTLTQPTTTADVTAASGDSGGSGGGSRSRQPDLNTKVDNPPITNVPPPPPQNPISQSMAQFRLLCPETIFTRNLEIGMNGIDVKCLQMLLNTDPETEVATTGLGSTGEETIYFRSSTREAVVKFQEKYYADILMPSGLTNGTGNVFEGTLAKIRQLFYDGVVAVAEPSVVQPVTSVPLAQRSQCPQFTTWLVFGMKNEEVKKLQQFLKDFGFLTISEPTDYFGPRTLQAVKDFQFKYSEDILKPVNLTAPSGAWWPRSIKKANELVGC